MTHASLFSGIGGPEVAAAMLGWDNLFHCEINPFGRNVLDYWFPDSVSYEDITKTDFRPWRGKVDVLTGGFPCQPFSYAGQRRGHEDDRYLWPQMLRAIDEIRPAWVVGENVAGITTMVEGGVLADLGGYATLFQEGDDVHGYELEQSFTIERICRDLEHIGYSVQPMLIPAAACGAPHRRDRIFILAADADPHRRNDLRGAGINERESVCEGVQERDEVRVAGVADTIRFSVFGVTEDPQRDGCGLGADAVEGNQRDIRDTRAGDVERVCRTARLDTAHPTGEMCNRGSAQTGREWKENPNNEEHPIQPTTVGLGGEWSTPYTDGEGRKESIFSGRSEDSAQEGAGMDDRAVGSRSDGKSTDPVCERLEREDESGDGEGGERMRVRRNPAGHNWETDRTMLPGSRWAEFPTVSPVHCRYDGFSGYVVRYINDDVYATIKEYFGNEDLSGVWEAFSKEDVRQSLGRLYKIHETYLLLQVVLGAKTGRRPESDGDGLSARSDEVSQRVLRKLRKQRESSYSPQGLQYQEQLAGELGYTLPALSFDVALAAKAIEEEVLHMMLYVRTESIKAYGNAIVPQVMYRIFQAIESATTGCAIYD